MGLHLATYDRPSRPTLRTRIVAGVDEVGRGPLAGPVVAAAVILDAPLDGIRDSKLLRPEARERLALALKKVARIGIGAASVAEIDRLNVLQASLLAMRRAVVRLCVLPDLVLVDGNQVPDLPCPTSAVVCGDRDVPAIGAASVVAKVARDRLMAKLARRHPAYGWETNVGYPTVSHREAILQFGVSCHHRRSFAPVRARLVAPDPDLTSGSPTSGLQAGPPTAPAARADGRRCRNNRILE